METNKPILDVFMKHWNFVIQPVDWVLAVLMTLVILFGIVDVGWRIYHRVTPPPRFILGISDMLGTLGAFMAMLIATELLVNITIFRREDVIHGMIGVATALTAIPRKVILDLDTVEAPDLSGLASVVLATRIGHGLVVVNPPFMVVRRGKDLTAGDDPQEAIRKRATLVAARPKAPAPQPARSIL